MTVVLRGLLILLAASIAVGTASAGARPAVDEELVQVVVALDAPPLAQAHLGRTVYAAGTRRLSLRAPASVSYVRRLASAQRSVQARIGAAIPQAQVRWRYRIVANGMAVLVPRSQVARLGAVPGVATLYPSVRYRTNLDRSPGQIGAPAVWGPTRATSGQGLKIGIIDEGVDQTHPFFNPAGYSYPAGFPKGQPAYATPKVIVARAFPPASPTWKHASKPFDPEHSSHGTHVAGIAAGNADTRAASGVRVSGVAPHAYIGNYKALTIPTAADVGLDGNSPELVAAIEAAVADGMDVINLSLGEPQIEPSRDIVALALDAAADAGVVPVVSAGNSFAESGRGSIGSPGTSVKAVTVAAVTTTRDGAPDVVAGFSSSGPSPLSHELKPEVSAPGVGILSAAPRSGWATLSGTSMAAPHVAGAAALLKQRHPAWTVAQLKSALAQTGDPAASDEGAAEAPAPRQGGGVVNLERADNPLLFASPTTVSFGLVGRGTSATRAVTLSDAGAGAGEWAVAVEQQRSAGGATVHAPPTVAVPGTLTVGFTVGADAVEGEATGFLVLTRGADRRRVPFWGYSNVPALAAAKTTPLRVPGTYNGNTRGRASLVSEYRWPEGAPGSIALSGPEHVFRYRLPRAVANFGVVVTSVARGARIEPRIVVAGDENRMVGATSLPVDANPYLRSLDARVLAAGAIRPAAGTYDLVFDSGTSSAGAFTFRFWVNDTTPPAVSLPVKTVRAGTPLVARVSDAGAGIYPRSLLVLLDGEEVDARYARGRVIVPTGSLRSGRHALVLQISDYQETRNMENTGPILPNTRVLRTTVRILPK
jgi:subtilisin family serine protease